MTGALAGWLQLGLLVAALAACYIPLGNYIAKVFTTAKHWRVERGIYKLTGIDPTVDQKWSAYLRSVLAFSAASVLFLYGMQRLQHYLYQFVGPPMANVTPATAFNTAISFTTNTNWQNYSGESTMTYIVQMSGLAVQNFVSAAVGMAIAIAMIRGFIRSRTGTLGNFWVDLTRGTLRVLLPLAVVGGLVLAAGGLIDNFSAYHTVSTLSGAHQTIVGGPVASQDVIKGMGNNGGGFFNAQSAPPFANPEPVHQHLRALPDPADPVQPDADVRQDGQGQPAGLHAACDHGDPLAGCGRRGHLLRDPPRHRRDRPAARARRHRGRGDQVRPHR